LTPEPWPWERESAKRRIEFPTVHGIGKRIKKSKTQHVVVINARDEIQVQTLIISFRQKQNSRKKNESQPRQANRNTNDCTSIPGTRRRKKKFYVLFSK
jgi:hypothetical protein